MAHFDQTTVGCFTITDVELAQLMPVGFNRTDFLAPFIILLVDPSTSRDLLYQESEPCGCGL